MDPAASEALFVEAVAALRSMPQFNGGGWLIESSAFPDLIVVLPHRGEVRRRFRFRFDGWDEKAPSVLSIDDNGEVLVGEPVGPQWTSLNSYWGLCVVGTREYHQHHPENPWAQHRSTHPIPVIVDKVYQYYRTSNG